jgi:SAM-dependent methyltransferase
LADLESAPPESPLPIQATWQAPHVEHLRFQDFASFQDHLHRTHPQWERQVKQALPLMALNGILDPISQRPVPASALHLSGPNYRESLEYNGCLSRHRAILLLLRSLLAEGRIPPQPQVDIYLPEAITPFAQTFARLFPRVVVSEYLPDPLDPRRQRLAHQDLCRLNFQAARFDLVVCNELFEHLYDLPAALGEIARILRPGGFLLATFPFAYNRFDTIVKARHRPGATPGVAAQAELLMEGEFHGDPVHPERGSLVYQIPGWDLLDQARHSGLRDPTIHWIAAPSYGILGQELPAVLVLLARRD